MSRRLSLPEHAAIELFVGVALIGAPFLLGFGSTALLTSMAAGALVIGIAVSDGASISAHMAADAAISAALVAAAVALAANGEPEAAGILAAAAAGELALGMATRWTRRA